MFKVGEFFLNPVHVVRIFHGTDGSGEVLLSSGEKHTITK